VIDRKRPSTVSIVVKSCSGLAVFTVQVVVALVRPFANNIVRMVFRLVVFIILLQSNEDDTVDREQFFRLLSLVNLGVRCEEELVTAQAETIIGGDGSLYKPKILRSSSVLNDPEAKKEASSIIAPAGTTPSRSAAGNIEMAQMPSDGAESFMLAKRSVSNLSVSLGDSAAILERHIKLSVRAKPPTNFAYEDFYYPEVCVGVCVCMYMCVCAYVRMCVCAYVRMCRSTRGSILNRISTASHCVTIHVYVYVYVVVVVVLLVMFVVVSVLGVDG
jgi:hypothetical protein